MSALFFSYSHKDEELRNNLETHLAMLVREGAIETWHDRAIPAGDEIDKSVDENLERAEVILLLVSADFLASPYCYEKEVQRAMQRHEEGSARVIPVILRPCDWKTAPFGKLLAAPTDAKPITTWADRDTAFLDVVRHIRAVLDKAIVHERPTGDKQKDFHLEFDGQLKVRGGVATLKFLIDEVLECQRNDQSLIITTFVPGYSDVKTELERRSSSVIDSPQAREAIFALRQQLRFFRMRVWGQEIDDLIREGAVIFTEWILPQIGGIERAAECLEKCFDLLLLSNFPPRLRNRLDIFRDNPRALFTISLTDTEVNRLKAEFFVDSISALPRGFDISHLYELYLTDVFPGILREYFRLKAESATGPEPSNYFDLSTWRVGPN